MGLFEKKICFVCQSKAGMLTREKLADGSYLCGDCQNRCSRDMESYKYKSMMPNDVLAHMDYFAQNCNTYTTQFHETDALYGGPRNQSKILLIDRNNGWFVRADRVNPDIISFSQVRGFRLYLDTHSSDPEHMPEPLEFPAEALQRGLPLPRLEEEVDAMKLEIDLEHPWISTLSIPIMSNYTAPAPAIYEGYASALALIATMEAFSGVAFTSVPPIPNPRTIGAAAAFAQSMPPHPAGPGPQGPGQPPHLAGGAGPQGPGQAPRPTSGAGPKRPTQAPHSTSGAGPQRASQASHPTSSAGPQKPTQASYPTGGAGPQRASQASHPTGGAGPQRPTQASHPTGGAGPQKPTQTSRSTSSAGPKKPTQTPPKPKR